MGLNPLTTKPMVAPGGRESSKSTKHAGSAEGKEEYLCQDSNSFHAFGCEPMTTTTSGKKDFLGVGAGSADVEVQYVECRSCSLLQRSDIDLWIL